MVRTNIVDVLLVCDANLTDVLLVCANSDDVSLLLSNSTYV